MEINERIERIEWAARRWCEAYKESTELFERVDACESERERENVRVKRYWLNCLKDWLEEYAYYRAGLVEVVEATEKRGDYAEHFAHYCQIEEFEPDSETGFIPFDKRARMVWFFYLNKELNK